jgi:hypothetical protein
MPIVKAIKINAVSRVSLSTLRNRITDNAPIKPKATARLLPITIIARLTHIVSNTSDCTNAREYESP